MTPDDVAAIRASVACDGLIDWPDTTIALCDALEVAWAERRAWWDQARMATALAEQQRIRNLCDRWDAQDSITGERDGRIDMIRAELDGGEDELANGAWVQLPVAHVEEMREEIERLQAVVDAARALVATQGCYCDECRPLADAVRKLDGDR